VLIQRLRDAPITWSDVKQLRVERKAQLPGQEAMWKARTSIELAQKFRRHYEDVRAAAEKH
jgi:hypothetical protein